MKPEERHVKNTYMDKQQKLLELMQLNALSTISGPISRFIQGMPFYLTNYRIQDTLPDTPFKERDLKSSRMFLQNAHAYCATLEKHIKKAETNKDDILKMLSVADLAILSEWCRFLAEIKNSDCDTKKTLENFQCELSVEMAERITLNLESNLNRLLTKCNSQQSEITKSIQKLYIDQLGTQRKQAGLPNCDFQSKTILEIFVQHIIDFNEPDKDKKEFVLSELSALDDLINKFDEFEKFKIKFIYNENLKLFAPEALNQYAPKPKQKSSWFSPLTWNRFPFTNWNNKRFDLFEKISRELLLLNFEVIQLQDFQKRIESGTIAEIADQKLLDSYAIIQKKINLKIHQLKEITQKEKPWFGITSGRKKILTLISEVDTFREKMIDATIETGEKAVVKSCEAKIDKGVKLSSSFSSEQYHAVSAVLKTIDEKFNPSMTVSKYFYNQLFTSIDHYISSIASSNDSASGLQDFNQLSDLFFELSEFCAKYAVCTAEKEAIKTLTAVISGKKADRNKIENMLLFFHAHKIKDAEELRKQIADDYLKKLSFDVSIVGVKNTDNNGRKSPQETTIQAAKTLIKQKIQSDQEITEHDTALLRWILMRDSTGEHASFVIGLINESQNRYDGKKAYPHTNFLYILERHISIEAKKDFYLIAGLKRFEKLFTDDKEVFLSEIDKRLFQKACSFFPKQIFNVLQDGTRSCSYDNLLKLYDIIILTTDAACHLNYAKRLFKEFYQYPRKTPKQKSDLKDRLSIFLLGAEFDLSELNKHIVSLIQIDQIKNEIKTGNYQKAEKIISQCLKEIAEFYSDEDGVKEALWKSLSSTLIDDGNTLEFFLQHGTQDAKWCFFRHRMKILGLEEINDSDAKQLHKLISNEQDIENLLFAFFVDALEENEVVEAGAIYQIMRTTENVGNCKIMLNKLIKALLIKDDLIALQNFMDYIEKNKLYLEIAFDQDFCQLLDAPTWSCARHYFIEKFVTDNNEYMSDMLKPLQKKQTHHFLKTIFQNPSNFSDPRYAKLFAFVTQYICINFQDKHDVLNKPTLIKHLGLESITALPEFKKLILEHIGDLLLFSDEIIKIYCVLFQAFQSQYPDDFKQAKDFITLVECYRNLLKDIKKTEHTQTILTFEHDFNYVEKICRDLIIRIKNGYVTSAKATEILDQLPVRLALKEYSKSLIPKNDQKANERLYTEYSKKYKNKHETIVDAKSYLYDKSFPFDIPQLFSIAIDPSNQMFSDTTKSIESIVQSFKSFESLGSFAPLTFVFEQAKEFLELFNNTHDEIINHQRKQDILVSIEFYVNYIHRIVNDLYNFNDIVTLKVRYESKYETRIKEAVNLIPGIIDSLVLKLNTTDSNRFQPFFNQIYGDFWKDILQNLIQFKMTDSALKLAKKLSHVPSIVQYIEPEEKKFNQRQNIAKSILKMRVIIDTIFSETKIDEECDKTKSTISKMECNIRECFLGYKPINTCLELSSPSKIKYVVFSNPDNSTMLYYKLFFYAFLKQLPEHIEEREESTWMNEFKSLMSHIQRNHSGKLDAKTKERLENEISTWTQAQPTEHGNPSRNNLISLLFRPEKRGRATSNNSDRDPVVRSLTFK